jgi:2,4-dienoyl-CoA reductase-like NADH-dependent reductase (Old Yellow Enzyme family)
MTSDKKWDYSQFQGYIKYPNLFKPIKIGQLEVPNRIKYAATEDNLNSPEGFVTDADVAYIRERAKGVVGGICTIQGVYMDPKGESVTRARFQITSSCTAAVLAVSDWTTASVLRLFRRG